MSVRLLDEATAASLRSAGYTYWPVGHTVGRTTDGPPPGYRWFERTATLRRRDFDHASSDLMAWELQRRAGLRVWSSELPLREGTVVRMELGLGPASLRCPCRVVYTVDEPDLRGFAYGTLPGHPESGEERFVLRRTPDGALELAISAFSRPASTMAKLSGPLGRGFQSVMTNCYLRALDRPPH